MGEPWVGTLSSPLVPPPVGGQDARPAAKSAPQHRKKGPRDVRHDATYPVEPHTARWEPGTAPDALGPDHDAPDAIARSGAFAFHHEHRRQRVDISVRTRCEVPARIREDVVAAVEHATRIYDRIMDCEVSFRTEPDAAEGACVEIMARTKQHPIRAEGCGSDHQRAGDAAIARFERQLRRYKSRMVDKTRHRAPMAVATAAIANGDAPPNAQDLDPADLPDPGPAIVRTKVHEIQAMLPDDAGLALELLGHDFYLFRNAANDRCSVVYRRRDGQLGLIEGVPAEA